jgi:hypothetical protein
LVAREFGRLLPLNRMFKGYFVEFFSSLRTVVSTDKKTKRLGTEKINVSASEVA